MSEDAELAFFSKCSAVVLDVAGTTTSIDFVKHTLFPFAAKNCEEYLKANFDNDDVKKALKLLKDEIPDVAAAITAFKELSAENSENEGLKIVQGLIYKEGYAADKLKAHIFPDVPTALETWAATMKIAIYSTGSIDSQKLLFAHTAEGDITAHITHYFDQTNIGSKTDKDSYAKIAKELNMEPEEIVFISDDVNELKAAREAKFFTALIKRVGNDNVGEDDAKQHNVITSFADLVGTGKRKCPVDETTEIKEPPTKVAKTDQPKIDVSDVPTVSQKKDEEEAMEVDSTTECKDDKEEVVTKEAEKVIIVPELEQAKKEDTDKMDTKEELNGSDKVVVIEATAAKEDLEKEEEISSTNEEVVIKKSIDDVKVSQSEVKIVTETSKDACIVDSTDANVTPSTTTEDKSQPKIATEDEMVADTSAVKVPIVETKTETEKTDQMAAAEKDEHADVAKVKAVEKKTDEAKETKEVKTVVEEVIPSSNGDSKHEKTDEAINEKDVIPKESDSASSDSVSDTTANSEAVKVEEKENKSELANGKTENGKAENGDTVVEDVKITEDDKNTAEDIKVKKIEDASDATAPVSVEA